jgi:DNA-binding NarL/FixJ family response regulator
VSGAADDLIPRVLVLATDRLARAGLAALLEQSPPEAPEVAVVGRVAALADVDAAIAAHAPDVIVLDVGGGSKSEALRDMLGEAVEVAEPLPLLVLVDDTQTATTALGAGARGVLPREVEPAALAAAVHALRHGLRVGHPELGAAVAPAMPASEALAEPLTPREHDVLALLAEGRSNRQIAAVLSISPYTVKDHVDAILAKLGAASRTEAAIRAARLGLIAL